ncbi:MAG: ArnT family glycosyltransferase [Bacteroidia bacterium]
MYSKRTFWWLFFLFTLGFTFFAKVYQWDKWLFSFPYSVHQWRQADGAALAWNYAQGESFFSPAIQNLQQNGDIHAAGEFPLTYWLAGNFMRFLGGDVWVLRWVHLAFFWIGAFAFTWLTWQFTKDKWKTVVISSSLFLSPFLMYYAPNYLPDTPALAMILVACACLYQAYLSEKSYGMYAATVFATLSVLLKMTFLLVPLCFLGLFILFLFAKIELPKSDFWRQQKWLVFTHFMVLVGIIFLFRLWISHYNEAHHSNYFFADIRPIWRYSFAEQKDILLGIRRQLAHSYGSMGLYLLCLVALIEIVKQRKTIPPFLLMAIFLHLGACFAIFILLFRMFREHDYYATCMMTFPLLVLLVGFSYGVLSIKIFEKWFKRLLFFLCFIGIYQVRKEMIARDRFADQHHSYLKNGKSLFEIPQSLLLKQGIPLDAHIFCPEDMSPNTLLLALRRKGYTYLNFGNRITPELLTDYQKYNQMNYLALTDSTHRSPLLREFYPKLYVNWENKIWIWGKE